MNTLTWAFILFFGWLVVRSIQQQSMSAQPTRTLIDEDLQKVGYIAGRGFHFARGIADMTAALLLVVWKVLTSDNTQKYAAGAISSTTALAGKLGDAARRIPLRNHRDLPSADVAPEDTSLNQQQGAAKDVAVLDCPSGNLRIVPVEQAEAAYRDARHDVKGLVEEQTENIISHMLIPSIPEFYEAGPDEGEGEEHEQPAQPANQGFGTARNRAQKSAKKNNQPRKGGASQTGGPSVPDFVRRLPRNK
jgi:hypothetical protein